MTTASQITIFSGFILFVFVIAFFTVKWKIFFKRTPELHPSLKEKTGKKGQDYRELFEHLPVSLWYEDFSQGKSLFDSLREKGIKDLRTYLNKHPEMIRTFARLTHIVGVNQATLKLYGARDKSELPKTLDKILENPQALETFKEALVHLYEGHVIFEAETNVQTFQGNSLHIFIRWTVSPGHEKSLDSVLVSAVDITKRKQMEERIRLESQRFAILHKIENALLQNQSLEHIAADLLPQIASLLECSRGSALRFDYEKSMAHFLAFYGKGSYQAKKILPLSSFRNLDTLQHGIPRIVEELSWESALTGLDLDLLSSGFRSCITFPLMREETLIGILNFGKVRPGQFPACHVDLVKEVANILSIAVHQASLQTQIRRHTKELEKRVAEQTQQLTTKIKEEKRLNAALLNVLEDLQATNKILVRTTEELKEANNELKIFTTSVSHDLRAPLRAIEGFGRALMEDYGAILDDTGREYLLRIIKASQAMDTLITDLLTYSHLATQKVVLQPLHLDTVIRQTLKTFSHTIETSGARIHVRYPLGWIMGHPTLLQQAADNLMSNALKFRKMKVSPEILIFTEEREEMRRLVIRDNGIGISPNDLGRIFNLFERLHGIETYPGTGVGLTIVQKGVRKMRGKVGVFSELGKGSTFWIDFLKAEPAETETRKHV